MRFRARSMFAQEKDYGDLDMTPMIDVVFQLIIFFMVSTTFAMTPGIQLNLPNAVKPDQTPQQGLVITLTADGGLYLNRQTIAVEELLAGLQALAPKPEQALLVNADGQVPHQRVVEVMDIARQAGVSRMAIATKPVQITPRPRGR